MIHRIPIQHGKLAVSVAGRRAAPSRWIEWASTNRTTRPLVWVHGASVGEGLTALPVVDRLRTALSDVQIVHSFTSPSAVAWSTAMHSDRSDYLPLDEPRTVARVFDAVKPTMLVCARGDLWPGMAYASAERRLPIAIISGTVRPNSRRLWTPVRTALRPVYRSVSWLGAASDGDADRWARLGVLEDSIAVTGDTRHDQVLERVSDLQSIRTLLEWANRNPVLVAGSTDEHDEKIILSAFSHVARANPEARLILVPHECSKHRIDEVLTAAGSTGVDIDVWTGGAMRPDTRCVVVSAMGILADVYAVSEIAYVGGGFTRGGLHAAIEPAALAVPVLVGPYYRSSTDAEMLVDAGGAKALPPQATEESLARTWLDWLQQDEERVEIGLKARGTLRQGAAKTTAEELLRRCSAPHSK